ncbi:hypothetical protein P152DRAFT_80736 [Eremomyces bilateralis CBS 781.70]|uniref:Uncharacterized protein n=1 Tax=Eremomyces bilateralis CBS 781.70 TaxID=1392243 RepID=A0A6G1FYU4_9PEZI|nr:uncharacterized protein P152DRAFT_80736 [Eremomyces bilateralis CBS 781.70]KAF1810729.1 hypothetical protein P152DRAFT_80736 [Eremomyces bilateralis CBS 781.70]
MAATNLTGTCPLTQAMLPLLARRSFQTCRLLHPTLRFLPAAGISWIKVWPTLLLALLADPERAFARFPSTSRMVMRTAHHVKDSGLQLRFRNTSAEGDGECAGTSRSKILRTSSCPSNAPFLFLACLLQEPCTVDKMYNHSLTIL